jgi:hypothetical protein
VTPACTLRAAEFYGRVFDTIVPVSSTRCAEMVKLLENTFRAVNIGLVNEVAMMCNRLGLDAWEVIDAAATKPFGFMPFYPGPGLGGHCIPIDPVYLSWKLKTLNFTSRFIDLATKSTPRCRIMWCRGFWRRSTTPDKPLKGARGGGWLACLQEKRQRYSRIARRFDLIIFLRSAALRRISRIRMFRRCARARSTLKSVAAHSGAAARV